MGNRVEISLLLIFTACTTDKSAETEIPDNVEQVEPEVAPEPDTGPDANNDNPIDTSVDTGTDPEECGEATQLWETTVVSADILSTSGCWSVEENYTGSGEVPGGYNNWSLNEPMPTNDWWSSWTWKYDIFGNGSISPFGSDVHAHPLSFKADAQGLHLHHAQLPTTDTADLTNYSAQGVYDLHIGLAGLNASEVDVRKFSDWTVTPGWTSGDLDLQITVGHGLPFAYVQGDGAAIQITGQNMTTLAEGEGYKIISVGDKTYGLFTYSENSWSAVNNGFATTNEYASIAVLPSSDEETIHLFQNHAYARPVRSTVTWRYNPTEAKLETQFHLETERMSEDFCGTPLMALYPHQWRATNADLTSLQYPSARGTMKILTADSFVTNYDFHGVLPGLPLTNQVDTNTLSNLLENDPLYAIRPWDWVTITPDLDTYWGGKAIVRLVNMLHIATLSGNVERQQMFLDVLKSSLQNWFDATGSHAPMFSYNEDWSTMIGYPSSYGSGSELNDHHFHWGHFITGAAAITMHDPDWANNTLWGGAIKELIRDAANPLRDQTKYPFMRNFDPYAGHSWANGPAAFNQQWGAMNNRGEGNNHESSSEAMHFAYSLIMYGEATNNQSIRDLGIYLYTTESAAIQDYWFDVHGENWGDHFAHEAAGTVWSSGYHYGLWFDGGPEQKLGIQYLPIHGGSTYLGLYPEKIQAQYDEVLSLTGGQPSTWAGILWSALALSNPQQASSILDTNLYTYELEQGESRSYTYQWIKSLSGLGQVDYGISADISTYNVFNQNNTRSYVAFNPSCASKTVNFSDGTAFEVDSRSMVTYRNGTITDTQIIGSCQVVTTSCETTAVEITLTVDTSCYPGTVGTVALNGPFWNWDPAAAVPATDNGDGTWSLTMPSPTLDMEYLWYINGTAEILYDDMANGGTCAPVTDFYSYGNRLWALGSDNPFDTFDQCDSCP